ncbi:MAG: hypothetical protein AAF990_28265 [Bacteroidota bacterium]
MDNWSKIKYGIYAVVGIFVVYSVFFADDNSSTEYETEEVVTPTEGIVTVVKEVETDLFKISDEYTVPDTSMSRIIANYLDNTSDTFTLQEARLVDAEGSGRNRSMVRAASMGLFGYMMLSSMSRRMSAPRAGAYVDQKTYDRVSKNAGSSLNRTASRTTRVKPGSGRSGYGSGRSTRSFGG